MAAAAESKNQELIRAENEGASVEQIKQLKEEVFRREKERKKKGSIVNMFALAF